MINRSILIILLIGIALSALSSSDAPALSGVVVDAGAAFFQMALLSYVILSFRAYRIPVARSLGFLLGILTAAQALSHLVSSSVPLASLDFATPASIGLLSLIVLVPVALIVFIPIDFQTPNADIAPEPLRPEAEVRADHLTERFGLTPRESEVALLLIQGRSLPYIQEKLFISNGTAKTHQRHLYEKMRVHSRQEFLDVAESSLSHDGKNA